MDVGCCVHLCKKKHLYILLKIEVGLFTKGVTPIETISRDDGVLSFRMKRNCDNRQLFLENKQEFFQK